MPGSVAEKRRRTRRLLPARHGRMVGASGRRLKTAWVAWVAQVARLPVPLQSLLFLVENGK